jgi:chromosome partitioning protein
VLVPNRIDRRTLEGRQLVEELEQLDEEVAPAPTKRSAYVRCFAAGQSVANCLADLEVRALADILEEK